MSRCYTCRHESLRWCSVATGTKSGPVSVWGSTSRKGNIQWVRRDEESGSVKRTDRVLSAKLFVSWLIKIPEALFAKLLNRLYIYDLWSVVCTSEFFPPSLLNFRSYTYWPVLLLNSVSLSFGSPSPTGEAGISSPARAVMDHRSRPDPWPQACSLKRVRWENKEIKDERWCAAHLKRWPTQAEPPITRNTHVQMSYSAPPIPLSHLLTESRHEKGSDNGLRSTLTMQGSAGCCVEECLLSVSII